MLIDSMQEVALDHELIHLCLVSQTGHMDKQCRLRSDAAKCGD